MDKLRILVSAAALILSSVHALDQISTGEFATPVGDSIQYSGIYSGDGYNGVVNQDTLPPYYVPVAVDTVASPNVNAGLFNELVRVAPSDFLNIKANPSFTLNAPVVDNQNSVQQYNPYNYYGFGTQNPYDVGVNNDLLPNTYLINDPTLVQQVPIAFDPYGYGIKPIPLSLLAPIGLTNLQQNPSNSYDLKSRTYHNQVKNIQQNPKNKYVISSRLLNSHSYIQQNLPNAYSISGRFLPQDTNIQQNPLNKYFISGRTFPYHHTNIQQNPANEYVINNH